MGRQLSCSSVKVELAWWVLCLCHHSPADRIGLVFRGAHLTGFLSHTEATKNLGEKPLFTVHMHPVDFPAVPQWVTDVLSLCLSLVMIVHRSCLFNSSVSGCDFFFNCRLNRVILVPVFILSVSSYWSVTKVKIHGLIHQYQYANWYLIAVKARV